LAKSESRMTPLPVPDTARSVLLFGGTFDPPHKAHVALPRAVRDRLLGRSAWLVYVPAAQSPHKPDGPRVSNEDRVTMLRLAVGAMPRCAVWTDEIDRRGPSYWVDTVRRAIAVAPPTAQIRFLIGSDQAAAFHRWRGPREILGLAQPIVMVRPPHRSAAGVMRDLKRTRAWSAKELEQWGSWIDDGAVMEASSTGARDAVGAGRAARIIPPRVRAYITSHGLYTARRTAQAPSKRSASRRAT
jgi:nicotinate-nucleotide adenylyltransferase